MYRPKLLRHGTDAEVRGKLSSRSPRDPRHALCQLKIEMWSYSCANNANRPHVILSLGSTFCISQLLFCYLHCLYTHRAQRACDVPHHMGIM